MVRGGYPFASVRTPPTFFVRASRDRGAFQFCKFFGTRMAVNASRASCVHGVSCWQFFFSFWFYYNGSIRTIFRHLEISSLVSNTIETYQTYRKPLDQCETNAWTSFLKFLNEFVFYKYIYIYNKKVFRNRAIHTN